MADPNESSTIVKPSPVIRSATDVSDNPLSLTPWAVSGTQVANEATTEVDMSSVPEQLAVKVRPPRAGTTYRVAITNAALRYVVPTAEWTQKFVTFRAIGQDFQIAFGPSAVTLLLDAVSTDDAQTPIGLISNANTGGTIKNGEEKNFFISDEVEFAVIGADTAGFFECWRSSQPV